MSLPPQPPVPDHRPPAAGAPRRLGVARGLTFTGIATTLVAIVVAVLAGGLFVRALPVDVLTRQGDDGPGVLASVPFPGAATVHLDQGAYTVYAAWPSGATPDTTDLREALEVSGPDGGSAYVRGPSVSGTVTMGGTRAVTVAGFTASTDGNHTLTATEAGMPEGSRLLVVEEPGFWAFFGSILGTVTGVFAALLVGATGLTLTVTGAVLWYLRTRPVAPGGPHPSAGHP